MWSWRGISERRLIGGALDGTISIAAFPKWSSTKRPPETLKRAGNPEESRKRLDIIRDLPMLEVTESLEAFVQALLASLALPVCAVRDAAHIAVAAVHEVDYLLTWNCRHLANAQIAWRIREVWERFAERMPVICTPEEFMGA